MVKDGFFDNPSIRNAKSMCHKAKEAMRSFIDFYKLKNPYLLTLYALFRQAYILLATVNYGIIDERNAADVKRMIRPIWFNTQRADRTIHGRTTRAIRFKSNTFSHITNAIDAINKIKWQKK